jgi:hypothetical protein
MGPGQSTNFLVTPNYNIETQDFNTGSRVRLAHEAGDYQVWYRFGGQYYNQELLAIEYVPVQLQVVKVGPSESKSFPYFAVCVATCNPGLYRKRMEVTYKEMADALNAQEIVRKQIERRRIKPAFKAS